jgi:predicted hydrocarbon binding protein
MPTSVRVPEAFTGLFDQAETYVKAHFDKLKRDPERGTIHVGDARYILVRGDSLTTGFLEVMRDLIGEEEAFKFWYRMARVIGREDSRAFCAERGLTDGPARLSTGPVHFAYTGWARVEIDDRSRPAPDDTYYLEYVHPNTFESESWRKSGKVSTRPVCVFSAGYSAGWCSEAFGLEVHAREVTCAAAGQSECRFVMSPWDHLDRYAAEIASRPRPTGP